MRKAYKATEICHSRKGAVLIEITYVGSTGGAEKVRTWVKTSLACKLYTCSLEMEKNCASAPGNMVITNEEIIEQFDTAIAQSKAAYDEQRRLK